MSFYSSHRQKKTELPLRNLVSKTPRSEFSLASMSDRALGNQMGMNVVQAKLKIGDQNDQYEKEADKVADSFVDSNTNDHLQNSNVIPTQSPQRVIQRMCAGCEEEELGHLRRKAKSIGSPDNQGDSSAIKNSLQGGQPIPGSIKSRYQQFFGRDLSHVKIHTGTNAATASQSINAKAFTLGNHIVFDNNEFKPQSKQGAHLLAHELTHVLQQRSDPHSNQTIRRTPSSSGSGTTPGSSTSTTSPPAAAPNGGLSEEMLRQIARGLYAAMRGPGTDEERIFSSFAGRTQPQVDAIERVYNQLFSRSLIDDLRDDLTDGEMARLAIYSPTANSGNPARQSLNAADMVAHQLHNAMDQVGTDESSIFGALSGRTNAERTAIKNAYRRLTQHELEADLRDELSGTDLVRAIRLLNQGMLRPEDELYLSMRGIGTDEDTLFRVLESMRGFTGQIRHVEAAYRAKYGDLIAHLRDDLTDEEYARAMRILGNAIQDVAFEDCGPGVLPKIRSLIPVGRRKVEHAIQVLSRGWNNMSASQKSIFNQFYDPTGAGFDDQFVPDVLANFRAIRREFDDDLTVECESNASMCSGQRLYYTYWSNIHVCPYFMTSTNSTREARDFVHELAHNAMLAVDRAYYVGQRAEYNQLTPRGVWSNQIPVIGALSRVISRSDTLYHPDAYSYFAFTVP